MSHLVIDVEATGPTPMNYSMIQIGCVDLDGNEFYAEFRPLEAKAAPGALESIGLTPEQIQRYPIVEEGMTDFSKWLQDTYGGKRIVTWSDNPAFDWQFINGYLHTYTLGNPLGWSMRRIGDLYAGHVGDTRASSKWKRMRDTKHTHNALDDARGNAEALRKVMDMIKFGKCDGCGAGSQDKCGRLARCNAAGTEFKGSCYRRDAFGACNPW